MSFEGLETHLFEDDIQQAGAQGVTHPLVDARFGLGGKLLVGAAVGFGMGGMSAEFSPLDLSWPVALVIALVAAGLSISWVRYAVAESDTR